MTATVFNSKLKKFLKDHDQNQTWLAKKLGVPATTMSSWMWGASSPRKERKDEILARLDFLRGQPLHHEPVKHTPNTSPKPRKHEKVIKADKLINPELERLIDTRLLPLTAIGMMEQRVREAKAKQDGLDRSMLIEIGKLQDAVISLQDSQNGTIKLMAFFGLVFIVIGLLMAFQ